MSKVLRILIAITIISTIGISLSYAETIWEKRQKALQDQGAEQTQPAPEAKKEVIAPVKEAAPSVDVPAAEEEIPVPAEKIALDPSNPFNITVPAMYGTIIDSHKGTNGKLIIHIQDAHANYEAQKNISSIIEDMFNTNKLKLILKEGNTTDKDFAYLRNKATLQGRIKSAENLLKDATISGIEYFTLTTNYPVAVQGLEDKQLYSDNKEALWEMDKFKDVTLEYLNKISKACDQLKSKVYNESLLSLDKSRKDYEAETIDLLGYYRALNEVILKKNISVSEFAGFENLMKIDEAEKKIDFVKINNNTATDEQKAVYKEYQDNLKNLNVNKIFKEELKLEKKILNNVAENDAQKELGMISKAISIMDKMLKVKVVPEEYGYFLENKKDF